MVFEENQRGAVQAGRPLEQNESFGGANIGSAVFYDGATVLFECTPCVAPKKLYTTTFVSVNVYRNFMTLFT